MITEEKIYLKDEIMEKVREKISVLEDDFDKELYYNKEELINQCSYEEGYEKRNVEIVLAMLNKNMSKKI